jgi:DNA repair exonuclease SbcCD ATPase subunit
MNKEVMDGLKSARKEKVEALQALQTQGAEAIKSLDEARESKDEGRVSEASEKFEGVGEAIKSVQKEIEDLDQQLGWFKDYQVDDEGNDVTPDAKRVAEMKSLFEEFKSELNTNQGKLSKTVGEYFADALKYRGIERAQDVLDLRADTQLTALLGPTPDAKDILGQYKSIKSIYTNHGVELLDASSDPVPGFMGFQCGLVEDTNVTCLLEPPSR